VFRRGIGDLTATLPRGASGRKREKQIQTSLLERASQKREEGPIKEPFRKDVPLNRENDRQGKKKTKRGLCKRYRLR